MMDAIKQAGSSGGGTAGAAGGAVAAGADTKFCSNCGKPIPRASKFCSECGHAQQ
jgi:zinc-ribbon domain